MNPRGMLLVVLLWAGLIGPLQAFFKPMFNLEQLMANSDLISVCRVEKVIKQGPGIVRKSQRGTEYTFFKFGATCRVLATFRGQPQAFVNVTFFVSDPYQGFGSLGTDQLIILFLKKYRAKEGYVFADEIYPGIRLFQYDPKVDAAAGQDPVKRIKAQLVAALDSRQSKEVWNALWWLDQMGVQSIPEPLMRLRHSENPEIKLRALTFLVKRKNLEAMKQATRLLMEQFLEFEKYGLSDLMSTFENVAQSVPVSLANTLAKSHKESVHLTGITILREIGDESSLPLLIAALDRKNQDAQYQAIAALSRISGQGGCPGSDHFEEHPDVWIDKWKGWWCMNKDKYRKYFESDNQK